MSHLRFKALFVTEQDDDFKSAFEHDDREPLYYVSVVIELSRNIGGISFNTLEVWDNHRWNCQRARGYLKQIMLFCELAGIRQLGCFSSKINYQHLKRGTQLPIKSVNMYELWPVAPYRYLEKSDHNPEIKEVDLLRYGFLDEMNIAFAIQATRDFSLKLLPQAKRSREEAQQWWRKYFSEAFPLEEKPKKVLLIHPSQHREVWYKNDFPEHVQVKITEPNWEAFELATHFKPDLIVISNDLGIMFNHGGQHFAQWFSVLCSSQKIPIVISGNNTNLALFDVGLRYIAEPLQWDDVLSTVQEEECEGA